VASLPRATSESPRANRSDGHKKSAPKKARFLSKRRRTGAPKIYFIVVC
jgi:hypothetical protein